METGLDLLDMTWAPRTGDTAAAVSVVIAMHNEADNVAVVLGEARAAFADAGAEIVVVDDGSTDGTFARACGLNADGGRAGGWRADGGPADGWPTLRVLRHERRCGKTAALRTGVRAARAPLVVTMDGDGQNDPKDARRLVDALRERPNTLAAGVRQRRMDRASRRVATRLANGVRRRVLRDNCPDTGCGLKAFAREDFLMLPQFEGMHRFLPALFAAYGRGVVCVPVGHRARHAGRSKYTNWGRALVGIVDLAGVVWLRARTHVPDRVTEG